LGVAEEFADILAAHVVRQPIELFRCLLHVSGQCLVVLLSEWRRAAPDRVGDRLDALTRLVLLRRQFRRRPILYPIDNAARRLRAASGTRHARAPRTAAGCIRHLSPFR
jgi:hypothetical protein